MYVLQLHSTAEVWQHIHTASFIQPTIQSESAASQVSSLPHQCCPGKTLACPG